MEIRMQLSLPRDARYVGLLRTVSKCILDDFGVPAHETEDVQLALTEACANVIRHAHDTFDYSVSLLATEDGCEVEVIDLGPGFDPPAPDAPAAAGHYESGRGVQLMRALVDDLQFIRQQHATRVRLVKRWTQQPAMADTARGD